MVSLWAVQQRFRCWEKPDIDFAVADCGFANLYDLLQTGYNQAHLGVLMPVVGVAYRLRYGYDLHDTNPIGALKNNEVPLCLIHGFDDSLIAPSNSEKLRDATKGYVELHLVDGAGHAESRELLGEDAYAEIISSFLKKALH